MSAEKRPRWLVFGAGGLVGGHVLRALGGRDVVTVARRAPVEGAITLDLLDGAAVTRVVHDVAPDVVVMAAAEAFVERCEREPAATREINVDAVAVVAAAAPRAVLVVFSSEYVFDGRAGRPYVEDDTVAPINEYGRQKVVLERIARDHGTHLICRVSGVYGWAPARTSFVAQLVDRLRAGTRFTVPADQLITPTPAVDLGHAVVDLVESGARGTFHVAGPEILPRPEFARRTAEAFALDASLLDEVPTEQLALAAPRPLRAGLLTDKLVRALGHGLPPSREALSAMRARERP